MRSAYERISSTASALRAEKMEREIKQAGDGASLTGDPAISVCKRRVNREIESKDDEERRIAAHATAEPLALSGAPLPFDHRNRARARAKELAARENCTKCFRRFSFSVYMPTPIWTEPQRIRGGAVLPSEISGGQRGQTMCIPRTRVSAHRRGSRELSDLVPDHERDSRHL